LEQGRNVAPDKGSKKTRGEKIKEGYNDAQKDLVKKYEKTLRSKIKIINPLKLILKEVDDLLDNL
jgi:hypothetical protein